MKEEGQLMLIVNIERPFMEEPLIPEEWDDIPEIPDERFTIKVAFSQITRHVMIAEAPMTKVDYIKQEIVDNRQHQNAEGPVPEARPGVFIRHGAHVVEVVMPGQEGNKGEAGDLSSMVPQKTSRISLVGSRQMMEDLIPVHPG